MRPNTPFPLVAADEVNMVVGYSEVENGCDLQRFVDRSDAEQLSVVRDELIAHWSFTSGNIEGMQRCARTGEQFGETFGERLTVGELFRPWAEG